MKFNQIRWGRAVGGFVVAEIVSIAAAIAWVAIYSYLLHPGEAAAFYEEYAKTASPYVSLILGPLIFFLICRRIGSRATAVALFLVYCLIEVPLLLSFDNPAITPWFQAVNFPTKFMACYWGARG